MPQPFVPGLELARGFYREAVRPILDRAAPGLPHSAALIGPGSDALGYDTARSTDHDWGPRLLLLLHPADRAAHADRLDAALAHGLPATYRGYHTDFGPPGERTRVMTPASGPVRHGVAVTDPDTWFGGWLGFDPRRGVGLLDWLATPTQRLAEVTGGAVFHDGLGALEPARERLRWYPPDVWRYVLACQWGRVAEEEAFVGRCAEVGDGAGAAVVAARLVRDLMRLHLLMRRRFPPYSKWLGTAVSRLPDGAALSATLSRALAGPDREAALCEAALCEAALCEAYADAARAHNDLGLTPPVDAAPRRFHDRPYRVIGADRFAAALLGGVRDPAVAALPVLGAIDHFADNPRLLGDMARCRAVTGAALGLHDPVVPRPAPAG